jgi:hypothetical protein
MRSMIHPLALKAVVVMLVLGVTNGAQTQSPKTALDYYQLLPDKYFEADRTRRISLMLSPDRGAIVDVRNGYIHAKGDGAQTDIYLRLFKRSDGGNLILVKHHASDSRDFTYLVLYAYQNGSWVEVTRSVLPVVINDELKYEIPRHGRAIAVSDKRHKKLYDLVWTGKVFRLRLAMQRPHR